VLKKKKKKKKKKTKKKLDTYISCSTDEHASTERIPS
jgi:hypothetical protein